MMPTKKETYFVDKLYNQPTLCKPPSAIFILEEKVRACMLYLGTGFECASVIMISILTVGMHLQAVGEELVELGNLVGDGQVDGAVTDLNDQTTLDVGLDLVDDLSLLSSGQNTGAADGSIDSLEQLLVEWDSRGNNDLNLTLVGSDELVELLDNGWEDTESVVLSKNLEEVLDLLSTVLWKVLEQLVDDGLLVGGVEGWGSDHWAELSILLEELSESGEGLCDGIQLGSLLSGSVQSGSIGTINTEESDWWLDGLLGSVCAERGDTGTAEDVACGEHCAFLI